MMLQEYWFKVVVVKVIHTEGFTDKTIAESELNWTEEDMWDCKTAR